MSYTVTEKGTVTIPVEFRQKYGLRKGSKVKFVESEQGMLVVPVVELEELFGSDRDRKQIVYQMIKELEAERRREATEG